MTELDYQKPAEGILKTGNFGPAVSYYIRCQCGNEDCAHDLEVEADDTDIAVHIYHQQHTKWWEANRFKQIWRILTKGYAEMQTTIILDEQTAYNYAETLKNAIKDVKDFKKK